MNKTSILNLFLFCIFFSVSYVYSQNPDTNWIVYYTSNSGLPDNKVYSIIVQQTYPTTRISYSIPKPGYIVLKVFDIKGRILKTLINKNKRAGNHHVDFDCSSITSGTFFINLRVGDNSVIKRMFVLK